MRPPPLPRISARQICNPINIPNINPRPVYTLSPSEYRPIEFVKFTKYQVYEKCNSSPSVFIDFAAAIYWPSLSLSGNL